MPDLYLQTVPNGTDLKQLKEDVTSMVHYYFDQNFEAPKAQLAIAHLNELPKQFLSMHTKAWFVNKDEWEIPNILLKLRAILHQPRSGGSSEPGFVLIDDDLVLEIQGAYQKGQHAESEVADLYRVKRFLTEHIGEIVFASIQ